MDLPVPPDTGGQHIESFTSSLKGKVETDAEGHRILTATIHHSGDANRRVRWQVEITGVFQTRQLVDGPPTAGTKPIDPPAPGEYLASTESINWQDGNFRIGWIPPPAPLIGGIGGGAFGQRVYAYLRTHGRYVYPPVSPWTSAACCQRLRTDCGGFSLTFAAGVPGQSHSGKAAGRAMLQGTPGLGRHGGPDGRSAGARDRGVFRSADRVDSGGYFRRRSCTRPDSAT